jgi:DNA-directed RNA polymerase specialized sigma24 family protein
MILVDPVSRAAGVSRGLRRRCPGPANGFEPFGHSRGGRDVTTVAVGGGAHALAQDFGMFYVDVFGRLAAYGASLTGDYLSGDELAQEALTRVFVRWGLLREPAPYAYRIVTNLARDRARQMQRERLAFASIRPSDPAVGPDASTLDAVRRLAPPLREVVLLHYYADLSLGTVAQIVRRPVGTVKRRLFDARQQLSQALREQP